MEQRWAVAYLIIAWNMIGVAAYQFFNHKKLGLDYDPEETTGTQAVCYVHFQTHLCMTCMWCVAELLVRKGATRTNQATVHRFEGFSYAGQRTITAEELAEVHEKRIMANLKSSRADESAEETSWKA